MSDYAAGKVKGQDDEQPEYAKEILYTQCASFCLLSARSPFPRSDPLPQTAVVRGVVCGSRDHFEDLNRCVEINKIVPVVDKVFAFDEAREAYRYLDSGAHFGKVVIELA